MGYRRTIPMPPPAPGDSGLGGPPLPRGRGALPREEYLAIQRARLVAAMRQAAGTIGYGATTLRELTRLAGVSKSVFYEVFETKEQCFLLAYEQAVGEIVELVSSAYSFTGSWEDRVRTAIRAGLEIVAAEPQLARVTFVEMEVVGPASRKRRDELMASTAMLLGAALVQAPGEPEIPAASVRALMGGAYHVVYRRLPAKDPTRLTELLPGLLYSALVLAIEPREAAHASGLPGAADFTTAGAPEEHPPRSPADTGGLPPSEPPARSSSPPPPPRAPVAPALRSRRDRRPARARATEDQRTRIHDAAMAIVAARGYTAAGVNEICARAHVSTRTFYAHFEDKQDAVLTAVEAAGLHTLRLTQTALAAAPSWPDGVWDALATMLAWAAVHPAYARTFAVELAAAGPDAQRRFQGALDDFAPLLDPGFELAPQAPPLLREYLAGAVLELFRLHTASGEPTAELPSILCDLARVVLTPFLGTRATEELVRRRSAET